MSILSSAVWPLVTGLVMAVFTVLLVRQYLARHKAHQLAWAIGFAMWAAASFMEAYAASTGAWPALLYRFYILTTAALVPVLGYGEIRLLSHRKIWAWLYLAVNVVLVGVFAYGVFTAPLLAAELAKGTAASYAALGPKGTFPRLLSAFISIPGALVLLWGPIYSIYLFWRKRTFAYRVWANVLIAAATLIIASAGGMAATGSDTLFYVMELVAAGLFLWGFLLADTLQKGAKAAVEARHAAQAESDEAGASTDS